MANEVNSEASASTKPPIIAVNFGLPSLHAPTANGAEPRDTAVLSAPIHAKK